MLLFSVQETLASDILVNCVLLFDPVPPFLTHDMLKASSPADRRLSVVVDVTCDYTSDKHALPFFHQVTPLVPKPLPHPLPPAPNSNPDWTFFWQGTSLVEPTIPVEASLALLNPSSLCTNRFQRFTLQQYLNPFYNLQPIVLCLWRGWKVLTWLLSIIFLH